jgi:hypothetical protein
VTDAHLSRWLTDEQRAGLSRALWQTIPVMHGLEAVGAIHKELYAKRAEANANAKQAKAAADRTLAAAHAHAVPSWVDSCGGDWAQAVTHAEHAELETKRDRDEAQRAADALIARESAAKAFEDRTVATRERIAEKRQRAASIRANVSDVVIDFDAFVAEGSRLAESIKLLERQLESARNDLIAHNIKHREADKLDRACRAELKEAAAEERAADELEATLAGASVPAPTDDERKAAAAKLAEAEAAFGEASAAVTAVVAKADAASSAAAAEEAEEIAKGLTATVDFLREKAAAELVEESGGIPGLGVDGDALTLDGVKLDALSGSEQIRLCVQIAKRAATVRGSEGRVLVADGLEQLDDEQYAAFLREATSGGWQLIATRVTSGELDIDPIEIEHAIEAAE